MTKEPGAERNASRTIRKRRPNYRLVKINRNYTIGEIADLLGKHKHTVRQWIRAGLSTCSDTKRPVLVLGPDLRAFLQARRSKNKRPCRPGEIYCVRCRAPKIPWGEMADYRPLTETIGNLKAICPDCGCIINRRVSLAKLGQVRGQMDITFPQALRQLVESDQPPVNCDFR